VKPIYLVRRSGTLVQWATSGGWTNNIAYASNWPTAMDASAVVYERNRPQREAASGVLATRPGPFSFEGHETLGFMINGVPQAVRFHGSAAYVDLYIRGDNVEPLSPFSIAVDGDAPQQVTFDEFDTSIQGVQRAINVHVFGVWTEIIGVTELRVHSSRRGTMSCIEISVDPAIEYELLHSGNISYGTGFAADLSSVTAAELTSHYMAELPDVDVNCRQAIVTITVPQAQDGRRTLTVRPMAGNPLEALGYPVTELDNAKLEIVEMMAIEVQPDRAVVSLPTNNPVLADWLESFGELKAANILRGIES
jgi:hypothetical protein